MSSQQFRPVGELNETESNDVVIERRDPVRWQGPLSEAVDDVIDDAQTVYLVEDGKRVAVIMPFLPTRD